MYARPVHPWGAQVKHAAITRMPSHAPPRRAAHFLTAPLSLPLLAYTMAKASSVCTPENPQPVHALFRNQPHGLQEIPTRLRATKLPNVFGPSLG